MPLISFRLPAQLLAELDDLVSRKIYFIFRAEAIREAVENLIAYEQEFDAHQELMYVMSVLPS